MGLSLKLPNLLPTMSNSRMDVASEYWFDPQEVDWNQHIASHWHFS